MAKRWPKSIRKYIRKQKSHIKRAGLSDEEHKAKVQEIYDTVERRFAKKSDSSDTKKEASTSDKKTHKQPIAVGQAKIEKNPKKIKKDEKKAPTKKEEKAG